jgi:hypothetical protein
MGLAALGALYYAWDQIRSSRADSHEATAKSLRSDYLLQALQYPQLANPDTSKLDFANEEYCGTRDKFFDYTWFVSYCWRTATSFFDSVATMIGIGSRSSRTTSLITGII